MCIDHKDVGPIRKRVYDKLDRLAKKTVSADLLA